MRLPSSFGKSICQGAGCSSPGRRAASTQEACVQPGLGAQLGCHAQGMGAVLIVVAVHSQQT